MANFEKMYYRLMNRVSDAIEILKMAQAESEEAFIDDTAELLDYEVDE